MENDCVNIMIPPALEQSTYVVNDFYRNTPNPKSESNELII